MTLWSRLERWNARAFLVGGGLWFADTALLGIELLVGVSVLGTPGLVNPVLYLSGLFASLFGLLGLYPRLAEEAPRLAKVSAGVGAAATAAIPLLLAWALGATALGRPLPPAALLILTVVAVGVAFVLFGAACLWTDTPSRAIGASLLGVVATLLGGLALVYLVYGGESPDWTSPAIGAVMSVLLLAIGYSLRTAPTSTDRSGASVGSTAGGDEDLVE